MEIIYVTLKNISNDKCYKFEKSVAEGLLRATNYYTIFDDVFQFDNGRYIIPKLVP